MRQDRAQQMAAALAFRTLFGLLPVLVVASVLVNSVAGMEQYLDVVDDLLNFVGLSEVSVNAESRAQSESLDLWHKGILGRAAAINLTAIGWVGLVVMIYAANSLMATIETSFNSIYQASGGRAWSRRIPLYWFILTISPVAIVNFHVTTARYCAADELKTA